MLQLVHKLKNTIIPDRKEKLYKQLLKHGIPEKTAQTILKFYEQ